MIEPPRIAGAKPGNICDYVEQNLEPFSLRPMCAPDSLVLSWYANFRLEVLGAQVQGWGCGADGRLGARLQETLRAECFDGLFDLWDPPSCRRLLQAMAASPRFRDVRVVGQVAEREGGATSRPKQFSAVTLLLDDGTAYLAFRGTDATFAGWREDFDMTFARPVPSQGAALAYVEDVAPRVAGPLVLGGHSKGGNLAVYAAAEAPEALQARIARVYSHDGPGFDAEFLASPGFGRVAARVEKTIPQSSIVGMMLENQEDYSVVRSTGVGIFQHDPFSWVVRGRAFEEVEGLSAGARHVDAAMNAWISGRTPDERERFTDELYDLLGAADAESMTELRDSWQTSLPAMAQRLGKMDPETRSFMLATATALVRELLCIGGAPAAPAGSRAAEEAPATVEGSRAADEPPASRGEGPGWADAPAEPNGSPVA